MVQEYASFLLGTDRSNLLSDLAEMFRRVIADDKIDWARIFKHLHIFLG